MCHISNSSPAASIKNKCYLTKEDADIGSDLFFAEVVKGKNDQQTCVDTHI